MDVPELLHAMAERASQVPGVAGAYYPPPNTIEEADCPAVVFFWGGPMDTRLERSNATSGTLWLPQVRAQVLVARLGDTPEEFGTVDGLLTPLVDAFAVPVAQSLPGLTGHVDHVWPSSIRAGLLIGYAGHVYFGAEIYFDIKFHRRGV